MTNRTFGVDADTNSINHAMSRMLEPVDDGQSEQTEPQAPEEETNLQEETPEVIDQTEEETTLEDGSSEESTEDEEDVQYEVEGQVDEDDQPELSEEPTYTIKLDGEEYEANLEELKEGYQRQQDYTRKTQEVSEERKQLQELHERLKQEQAVVLQMSQDLQGRLETKLKGYSEAELAALAETDPVGYVQKMAEKQKVESELVAEQQKAQRLQAQKQAEDTQRMQAHLAEQQALLNSQINGWGDAEKGEAIRAGIAKFAETQGYSPNELNNIVNARDMVVLNKARMYDEMIAKQAMIKKKKTAKKPTPSLKAKEPKSKSMKQSESRDKMRQKLKNSGSVNDAVAALLSQ